MDTTNLIFEDVLSTVLDDFPSYIIHEDGRVLITSTNKDITFHERNGLMYTRSKLKYGIQLRKLKKN